MNVGRIRRVFNKRPDYIVRRVIAELSRQTDRWRAPLRAQRLTTAALLAHTGAPSISALWQRLCERKFVCPVARVDRAAYESLCDGDTGRILAAADRALAHEVDLLGSGLVKLGAQIDWSRDAKSGFRWPPAYFASINYNNPKRHSDVKFPWELSRLQWLMPVGQAYLLTGEEKYAAGTRQVIEQWIAANPYAGSVNWSCTMEVALRILSLGWFFHVFATSASWQDAGFQSELLRTIFLHGDFTARHLERSEVNGNHYTADAAGLVFAGLLFGDGEQPRQWLDTGWSILLDEMPRQVFADGVDFEASVAYHRLVQELFLLPAIYRQQLGFIVPDDYRERLIAMARFTAAYSRPDGTSPLWGDADDARALPFGGQPLNDHRYLVGIAGALYSEDLLAVFSGSVQEAFWLLGEDRAKLISLGARKPVASAAFPEGGFYVMRNDAGDHVFIDCGPLGLAGRGGHGHNDLLAFEAALTGVRLIVDCGAYLYTADYAERNRFRSTAYHNTPQVADEEINRFLGPDLLWVLHNDAAYEVHHWSCTAEHDEFTGAHDGYGRMPEPVKIVRHIRLEHDTHRLRVTDVIEGHTTAAVTIPLHLAPGVIARIASDGSVMLARGDWRFILRSSADDPRDWRLSLGEGRVSESYGKVVPVTRLLWQRQRAECDRLSLTIEPELAGPSTTDITHA